MPLRLEDMNWMEFEELVPAKMDAVILPVGTIEAHGVTNLGTDVSIPVFIAERIAEDLKAIIAPPVYYGITGSLYSYPGSLTVSSPVFESYLTEIMLSLADKGFSRILVINGHGGHIDELKSAAMKVHREKKAKVAVIHWWILCEELTRRFFGETGGHAVWMKTQRFWLSIRVWSRREDTKRIWSICRRAVSILFPAPVQF